MPSSMTEECLSFCLLLAVCKEKVDKLKLVEVANQFCFGNEHHFSTDAFKNRCFPRKFTEDAANATQKSSQSCSSVEYIWVKL